MILLYTILSLAVFWIMGYAVIKLLKCGNCEIFVSNFTLYIVFGCVSVVSIVMILGLIMPLNIVTVILCIFIGIFLACNYKEIFKIIAINSKREERYILGIATVPMFLIGLPQILRNELYTSILANNDFGYYIASIEWLKSHSILQTVEYSLQHPFYSMAEYMIDYTRIGTDSLGAFLANVFDMESHEVFPILGTIAVVLLFLVAYEVIHKFTYNYIISVLFALFTSLNGNIITLIEKQYMPQLLGIAMLILTLYMINRFFEEANRDNIILCGLSISGLLAFYCEFAVYLTLIIMVYIVVSFVKKKKFIFQLIQVCVLSALFNPYGMYKALKFNLSIFTRVSTQGAQDIDPYRGNMLGIKKIIGCLLGFSDCFSVKNIYYNTAIISGMFILMICVAMLVINIKQENMKIILIPIFVFSLLQVYFSYSKGAYQEYKHITSVSVIGIMLMGCIVGLILQTCKKEKIVQYGIVVITLSICMCGVYNPLKICCENKITVDSETMQLREAVEQNIPISTEIEIDSSIGITNYMAAVYALKDYNINLNTDSSSYLQYFQRFEDNDWSKYVLYEKGKEYFLGENDEIVWSNKKYVLIKRKNIDDCSVMDITSAGFGSRKGVFISEEAGYVENEDGHEGMVLYGPYAHIDSGTYEIILNYSIMKTNGESGYFDIYEEGGEKYYQDLENGIGNHKLIIENQTFNNEDNVEFRVFANEGTVIKVEGIKYRRLSDET